MKVLFFVIKEHDLFGHAQKKRTYSRANDFLQPQRSRKMPSYIVLLKISAANSQSQKRTLNDFRRSNQRNLSLARFRLVHNTCVIKIDWFIADRFITLSVFV